MLTECPYCHIQFDVTDERLQRSSGSVRCDQCNTVFVATPIEAIVETEADIAEPAPELEPTENIEVVTVDAVELENLDTTIDKVELDDPAEALEDVEIKADDIDIPDMADAPALEAPELTPVDELHVNEIELSEETIQTDDLVVAKTETLDNPVMPAPPVVPDTSVQWSENNVHSLNVSSHQEAANADWLTEHEKSSADSDDAGTDVPGDTLKTDTDPQHLPATSETRLHDLPRAQDDGPVSNDKNDQPEAGYDPRQLYPELNVAESKSIARQPPGYLLASIMLIFVFILQSTYLLHDELAKQAGLRPFMQQFCEIFDCHIELPSAPHAIVLRDRQIRSHPNIPGALSVAAKIENTEAFTQHYPLLQLQFRDITGQIVAGRNFQPSEYLPKDVSISAGISPNKLVNVALELTDPGEKAVSYLFIFK